MTVWRRLLPLMPAIWLVACTAQPASREDDAFFADLVQSRYAQPFRQGNLDAWLAAFADDATALHNRRPADSGKVAIEAFGRLVFTTFRAERFELKVREVRRQGNWALTRGDFASHLVFRDSGESAPWGAETGKFLLLWERGADGVWRIVLDMGNAGSDQFGDGP
ncbi:MAG: nuclear transport factor 2 family protein [Pseudomonadales bacterium]|nr:nuclear transport factor 2 family protein [Pseudomonadales bacterium]MCP5183545.1 nuclear transport factor 2 family protein [Pseudomonadales bacterium]